MPQFSTATLYSNAMSCNACFGPGSSVERALVKLPQPRWIGSTYTTIRPRIVVVALNPGAGGESQTSGNLELAKRLYDFSIGKRSFDELLAYQAKHMSSWGKKPGRFVDFYTDLTGRTLNELAFLNIALCATVGNSYPSSVLATCFNKHTAALLVNLEPDVVLLSGSNIHKYASKIRAVLPSASVEPVLHYAHREGIERDSHEFIRVREFIAKVCSASGA